jgi:DNA-binding CsgD family transcriptional regulator
MGEAELADTVAAFYDAATSPELWPAVGERLAHLLGARVVVARLGSSDAGLGELVFYTGPMPTPQPEYVEYYHKLDPHLAAALAPPTPEARRGILGHEFMDLRAYRRSEFYSDFGRRVGIAHTLGASTRLEDGAPARLGLFRPETMESFGAAERRLLAALMPHFWRALELSWLRPPLDAAAAGLGVLDALARALVVVDEASRVSFANAAAVRLADTADGGLRLMRLGPVGRDNLVLSAAHREDAATLAKAIGRVTRRGSPGEALRLRRVGGGRAPGLAALVSPLPARLPTFGARPGVAPGLALVIVTDPSQHTPPSTAMLSEVFGLSRSEAAVASALAGGRSADEVARARGTGLETVRSQIRSVLSKTGAVNLRDLERVLASLPTVVSLGAANHRSRTDGD